MEATTKEPGTAVSHYMRKLALPLVYLFPNSEFLPDNITVYLTLAIKCTVTLKTHDPPLHHMQLLPLLTLPPHHLFTQMEPPTRKCVFSKFHGYQIMLGAKL